MEYGVLNIKVLKDRRRQLRRDSTKAENILWKELRKNQIGHRIVRQFSIAGYVIDFYCPKFRLGIELEGGIHQRKFNKIYDKYREEYLKSFGVKLIKISNEKVVKNVKEVIDRIKCELTPSPSLNQREGGRIK